MPAYVESLRGAHRETIHPISAVLVERGKVAWQVGEPVATYWRSASKPFQLTVSLGELPRDVVDGLSAPELAVGAASHSGEPGHVELVARLLARLGGTVDALQCGAHAPMHEPSAHRVEAPTNLHSNCSGKHSFMLAACLTRGWDADYRPISHPLQQKNLALLDALAGHAHAHAVDGCSVPTFHAPLDGMARAWSNLAEAMADNAGDLGRIGWAMHEAPWFMSGTDRLDEAIVRGAREPVAVKIGAEGLFCVAMPTRRAALAVKCHTGNADALAVAVRGVLGELGVRVEGEFPWADVRNVRGVLVGERRLVVASR
jgi:L-asparaginase II